MAGPAAVIVAGLATAWIAARSNDGLVVDDYYRQGLAINRTLARSEAAERMGVSAELTIADGRVRVALKGASAGGPLTLSLVHPTRAGMDQRVALTALAPGLYEARLSPPQPGNWHVVLEERSWRLAGVWALPATHVLTLDGKSEAANTNK